MSILQLILTAITFHASFAVRGEPAPSCTKARILGDVLLQRGTKLQAATEPLHARVAPTGVRRNTAAVMDLLPEQSQAAEEAMSWWSWFDVFGDEARNLTASWPKFRHHHHHVSSWTRKDKAFLAGVSASALLLDVCVLQRLAIVGLRQHLLVVALWIGIGLGFNVLVGFLHGPVAGVQWCSGYILEWLLSFDNLFVFHLIFRLYRTPPELVHKALFFGIVGAVICRLWFFAVVSWLLDFVGWLRFVFGAFLIWSGIQAARDEEETEISEGPTVKGIRWFLGNRLLDNYGKEADSLVLWQDGKLSFTLLLPVVCCLEVTDVVFALDSVSAKAAQIPNYWISVSSSILAMFALRAMFFVVQDLVELFDLLKYGLCCILVFIGVELMISDYVVLPPQVVCAVIFSVFVISIFGSSSLMPRSSAAAQDMLQSPKLGGDCNRTLKGSAAGNVTSNGTLHS
mmetsp:Transcript_44741/g.83571  ORF Transcript_44741/g.83571 Transcript_44741/m.83571 type:complete len:456 (-) Transcript_44741:19-1386(-)